MLASADSKSGVPARRRIGRCCEGDTSSRCELIRFHFSDRPSAARSGSARALADDLYGSLGIEVDGVDIARGRLEDRLVPATTALVEAVARLLEGAARTAAVPFDEGSIELLLARHGEAVTLSLVSLPRPARVLVRDLEVELCALAAAAGSCGRDLQTRLDAAGDTGAATMRLGQALRRLARAELVPGDPLPAEGRPLSLRSRPPAGGTEAPALGFDLRDEDGRLGSYEGGDGLHALLAPGHVYLHAPDGEELCAVAGSPFLLLRDLADVGLRLLEAARDENETAFRFPLGWDAPSIDVDLPGGALTVAGRTLRCPADALARSLFAGALDLGGALLARNPRLGHNPYLASLMEEARERLALCEQLAHPARAQHPLDARAPLPRPTRDEPPLAPGALRRVSVRLAWQAQVGPIRRLHPVGGHLWALGRRDGTLLSLASGAVAATAHGSIAVAGRKAPLLVADGAGTLSCVEPTGETRWVAALGVDEIAPRYLELPGGRAAVVGDGASLQLLDLGTGARHLALDPPAAARLLVASAGELVAAGADNGLLYGVDAASGEVAWRVPVDLPIERLAVLRDRLLVLGSSSAGTVLLGFAAATGEPLFRTELQVTPVSDLLAVPGGWVISGSGRPGGELVGIGVDGSVKWRARPNVGHDAPAVTRAGSALFARGDEGACRIERGKVRWNVPCSVGGAPVLARGVLVLPGEELQLLDAASGRGLLVTGATSAVPPVDLLAPTPEGLLIAADREGDLAALRLAGALAVV